jgi:hypothetical protein
VPFPSMFSWHIRLCILLMAFFNPMFRMRTSRYLTVLYYQPNKVTKKMDLEKKRAELEALKARHGVDGSTPAPMKKASA